MFDGDSPIFTMAINIMLFVIGILSVMLIYGGIRYVLSSGDAGAVQNAKNTIMYAIIGLVIAILAAIVNFVITSITNKNLIKSNEKRSSLLKVFFIIIKF